MKEMTSQGVETGSVVVIRITCMHDLWSFVMGQMFFSRVVFFKAPLLSKTHRTFLQIAAQYFEISQGR
jgi:hypothetical protein